MGICVHGHKTEQKPVGEEYAHCPVCQVDTHMTVIEITKRKTCMYIPCGSGSVAGHVMVCNHCGKSFNR